MWMQNIKKLLFVLIIVFKIFITKLVICLVLSNFSWSLSLTNCWLSRITTFLISLPSDCDPTIFIFVYLSLILVYLSILIFHLVMSQLLYQRHHILIRSQILLLDWILIILTLEHNSIILIQLKMYKLCHMIKIYKPLIKPNPSFTLSHHPKRVFYLIKRYWSTHIKSHIKQSFDRHLITITLINLLWFYLFLLLLVFTFIFLLLVWFCLLFFFNNFYRNVDLKWILHDVFGLYYIII